MRSADNRKMQQKCEHHVSPYQHHISPGKRPKCGKMKKMSQIANRTRGGEAKQR